MNSIHDQQTEDNINNLQGKEAIEKIKELAKKSSTCFFCTDIETGKPFAARPMAVQKVDDDGCLWFLSAKDSHKNLEALTDPAVQLLFQGSDYSDFMSIYGTATISRDKAMIKELWSPLFATWFTEGVDDPRITLIKIDPVNSYYWDTKHNMAVGLIKRTVGAIIGKTMDDSVEGTLNV